ncbi:hypothetical protein TRVA0_004S03114 [Trichomonascus vanleenenianus]|uniref:Moh1p n=1 Tax=Trichomonascus vanleenenianus TaxID=2268995 RepID=UPI003ECAA20C
MGVQFNQYLTGKFIYGCAECQTHLALGEDLISEHFRGRTGEACLFGNVVNVERGPLEERTMLTGRYMVQDTYCRKCSSNVGWAYVNANEEKEKYKENKFILELKAIKQVK